MNTIARTVRHARLTMASYHERPSPPFLVLFVNSICNMKCEHCFYWRQLNQRDDLTTDELFQLSRSLGQIENLNLSGGEPFLRRDLGEICRQFVAHNKVRQIYVPSNGWYTKKMREQIEIALRDPALDLFAVELSLDGTSDFHDRFRGAPGSFARAMETYDALADLQSSDARLRIHAISTATDVNTSEIRRLTTYLYDRCPKMDHHNLALIRGDRKNPALSTPAPGEYEQLYDYVRRLWHPREDGRYGAIVEPMLQWAKMATVARGTQVVPCRAGVLSAVVYANGDVGVCELHEPLGNLRQRTFPEIWMSPEARRMRQAIANKQCHCTTEVFLWPSIVFQPASLVRAMVGGRVWRKVGPVTAAEREAKETAGAPATAGTQQLPARRTLPIVE